MQKPIIVFDSGKGGRSIYNPLSALLPHDHLIYRDDAPNFPYGNKSSEWLTTRLRELAKEWDALDPKLVVLACNTATVNVVEVVRAELACPVVGVEPVIKPLSTYKKALVLMTASSANSTKTKELLATHGTHIQVFTPSSLAEAIEYNDTEQVKKSIKEIKKIVQEQKIQAVGLSCTHYPLIINELKQAMPEIAFIDPSDAVVRQAMRVLRSIEHGDI